MAKGRILLVEDHEDTAVVTVRLLQRAGYDVMSARTIAEAERLCASHSFDLLVSDLQLPDGDGTDLLEGERACSGMPAIAVSAAAYQKDVTWALRAGFRAHLAKPATSHQLLQAIEMAMEN